jgi:hypothetical protein
LERRIAFLPGGLWDCLAHVPGEARRRAIRAVKKSMVVIPAI